MNRAAPDPTVPSAAALVARCRGQNLFVRDAASMSPSLGTHTVRLAVKHPATNTRMVEILREIAAARKDSPAAAEAF